jgi:hypothetical protein
MAGWIPLEKKLLTDPRFTRLVAQRIACGGGDADSSRYRVTCVTHVLGALAMLWMHADTHIDEHDELRDTPDEIDSLLGWPGFCSLMPVDWLLVTPAGNVKLPDYQEHTGATAQKRLLAQRRKQRSRTSVTEQMSRTTVTDVTLQGPRPDQTRPDLKKDDSLRSSSKESHGTRLPKDWQPDAAERQYAIDHGLDVERVAEDFREWWLAAPGVKGRKADWPATWRTWVRKAADERGRRLAAPPARVPRLTQESALAALTAAVRSEADSEQPQLVWPEQD